MTETPISPRHGSFTPLSAMMPWPQVRNVSLKICDDLTPFVGPAKAADIACKITGVPAAPTLTLREAQNALARLGIGFSQSWFYAIANRAEPGTELWINAQKQWDASVDCVTEPLVRLVIMHKNPPRFLLFKLEGKSRE